MIDTIDKIVTRYFTAVTSQPFTYKKKSYVPQPLQVSDGIFWKTMKCPAGCGACCHRFTLDYTDDEYQQMTFEQRIPLRLRKVPFDGGEVFIWTDDQDDVEGHHCRNLNMDDGRCGIHGHHPFSCDFELMRFFSHGDKGNRLDHAHFGRGWKMLRIDGERGALCEWTRERASDEDLADIVRKLERLRVWAEYFGLSTVIPQIIKWLQRGPHDRPLRITHESKGFGF